MTWQDGSKTSLTLITVLVALAMSQGPVDADYVFGKRVNLGPVVNSPYGDYDPSIAPDGLSLYFGSTRPSVLGGQDLWVTARVTVSDSWGPPVNLGAPVNSGSREGLPSITADGLALAFSSNRPGGLGGWDIWLATRPTKESPWGPPVNLGSPVNSAANEFCGCISPDGCSLYFSNAYGSGNVVWGGDIWVTTRPTRDSSWGPPVNLGLMPSRAGSGNWDPSLSADGLCLFFDSDYATTALFPDIWLATRTSKDGNWRAPVLLGPEINTTDGEQKPGISADGSTLYWCSGPSSNLEAWDLWQASLIRIVDFTGDGLVDGRDLLAVAGCWGESDPLCDIGPMPWGDGVVDVEDLKVLAEYIGKEVDDPTLIAHWLLDETDGGLARNRVGDPDAFVMGNPAWKPDGGKVGGALQFDGAGDFLMANYIAGLGEGSFSVLAWIKGGAPGEVVICNNGRTSDWLYLDSPSGKLATNLNRAGRNVPPPLVADVVIADGKWHRVGLVWDGVHRILLADDREVARDTQAQMTILDGGLLIGAGKDPATFWSGLIDDVRIYDRVVRP